VIEFTIGLHGGYLRIGDVIEVMDNKKISQQAGGRIMSRVNDSTIEIDIPVDAISNATKIYIQKFASSSQSSESSEANRPSQFSEHTISSTNGFEVTVDGSLDESVQSSYVWMVKDYNDDNGDPIKSKQYRIKEISESEASKYKITALLYNPEKYKYIDQPLSSSDDQSEEYVGHQISTSDLNA
jgi:predicted phage tail protein